MNRIVLLAAVLAALALAAPAHAFGHHRVAVVGVPMSAGCSAPAFAAAPVATYAAPVTTYAAPVTTYAVAAPAPAMQMVPVSLAPVQLVAPQATYAVAPQAAYAPPQGYRLVPAQQQTMPRADDCDSFGRRDSFERLGPPRAGAAGPSTGELSDRLDRLSRAVEELAGNVRQLQKK